MHLFETRMTLYEVVFFFPSFYLQLDAIKHGLDSTFAFYSVRPTTILYYIDAIDIPIILYVYH